MAVASRRPLSCPASWSRPTTSRRSPGGRASPPAKHAAALTWYTGSVCASSVRPVRQRSGSSGWLTSHTSTSPLYSPPAGPRGPGQEPTHAAAKLPGQAPTLPTHSARTWGHFLENSPEEETSWSPGLTLQPAVPRPRKLLPLPGYHPPPSTLHSLQLHLPPFPNVHSSSPLSTPQGCLLLPAACPDQATPLHGPHPLKTQLRTCPPPPSSAPSTGTPASSPEPRGPGHLWSLLPPQTCPGRDQGLRAQGRALATLCRVGSRGNLGWSSHLLRGMAAWGGRPGT